MIDLFSTKGKKKKRRKKRKKKGRRDEKDEMITNWIGEIGAEARRSLTARKIIIGNRRRREKKIVG